MMNATMHELHSASTVLMIARFCCDPWTIPALNDGQYIHRNRVPIIANLRQASPPRKIKTINENRKKSPLGRAGGARPMWAHSILCTGSHSTRERRACSAASHVSELSVESGSVAKWERG